MRRPLRKTALGSILFAGALLALAVTVEAQQPKKVPLVGILTPDSVSARISLFEAFKKGLREVGYVEGQNMDIEVRSAEGKRDRLSTVASELVRLKVDVILTSTTPAIQAAKQATTTIPIVAISTDPVGTGLVASLARPGGNITGLSLLGPEINGKQLELLKETLPKVKRVAFVGVASGGFALRFKEVEIVGRELGLQTQSVEVRSPNELERALESATREQAGALIVTSSIGNAYRRQIVDFAAKNQLPAIYDESESVEAGGLMSYGANLPDLFRRAATYVDKILKGSRPADLPVEQPKKFEFIINLKAAKQIRLTIPPNVLVRADKVIK